MINPYRNRNVQVILLAGSLHSITGSILWVLVTFLIYGLGGSNADYGRILGIANIIGIVISLLASYLADKTKKEYILITSLVIEVIGAYILSVSTDLYSVFIGQILVSLGNASIWPVITAIFSLSIPTSKKNRVFGTNFMLNNIFAAGGSVITYFVLKDANLDNIATLNLDLIRSVIRISFYILLFTTFVTLFVREKNILSKDEENEGQISINTDNIVDTKHSHKILNPNLFERHTMLILSLSLLSSYMIGLGAGISIPYLPRFFFDIYHIDLANLNLLFAGMIVFTAIWGKINANLADRFGRNQLIVVNQLVSVLLLTILSTIPPLFFALLALIVRNAAMNGTGPLFNAIQMDYTPRRYRSQLNAINGVAWGILFSLGQIFGGVIVDMYGFTIPLITTSILYLLASLPFLKIKSLEEKVRINRMNMK